MSGSKQLLILPEGKRFSEAQRKELADNGFIVTYMKDPSAARLICAEPSPVSGDAMLLAALRAVRRADDYNCYRIFVDGLVAACAPTQEAKP